MQMIEDKIQNLISRSKCQTELDYLLDILYLMSREMKYQNERIKELETKVCETNMRG